MAGELNKVESMSDLSREVRVTCPYCGESFPVFVDCSAGSAEYVEDCRVCCQPIVFQLSVDTGGTLIDVSFSRENE